MRHHYSSDQPKDGGRRRRQTENLKRVKKKKKKTELTGEAVVSASFEEAFLQKKELFSTVYGSRGMIYIVTNRRV